MIGRCSVRVEVFSKENYRPDRNKNPGGSKSLAELESLPLKGQGFLDNTV